MNNIKNNSIDISKIKLKDSQAYNIKDLELRERLKLLLGTNYLEQVTIEQEQER